MDSCENYHVALLLSLSKRGASKSSRVNSTRWTFPITSSEISQHTQPKEKRTSEKWKLILQRLQWMEREKLPNFFFFASNFPSSEKECSEKEREKINKKLFYDSLIISAQHSQTTELTTEIIGRGGREDVDGERRKHTTRQSRHAFISFLMTYQSRNYHQWGERESERCDKR